MEAPPTALIGAAAAAAYPCRRLGGAPGRCLEFGVPALPVSEDLGT